MEKADIEWFIGIIVQLAIAWWMTRKTANEKPSKNRKRRQRRRR